jgi:hypothetical protein
MFLARVGAIAVLVSAFLFDANFLAPMTLVAATDPPNVLRFLAGHCVSVLMAGIFAAAGVLAIEGLLIVVLGERFFQRISLAVQGAAVTVLVMALLLFPVLAGVTPALLQSNSAIVLWLPPYWFLGIDQWLLEGSSALPVYGTLAKIACVGTLMATGLAAATYPIAYFRRARQLVEGSVARSRARSGFVPLRWLLHRTAVQTPERRAAFHFIQQTLQRVPRYRIYLVLYGGVGVSRYITAGYLLKFQQTAFVLPSAWWPSGRLPGCAQPLALRAINREAGCGALCMAVLRNLNTHWKSFWLQGCG